MKPALCAVLPSGAWPGTTTEKIRIAMVEIVEPTTAAQQLSRTALLTKVWTPSLRIRGRHNTPGVPCVLPAEGLQGAQDRRCPHASPHRVCRPCGLLPV